MSPTFIWESEMLLANRQSLCGFYTTWRIPVVVVVVVVAGRTASVQEIWASELWPSCCACSHEVEEESATGRRLGRVQHICVRKRVSIWQSADREANGTGKARHSHCRSCRAWRMLVTGRRIPSLQEILGALAAMTITTHFQGFSLASSLTQRPIFEESDK